jgi:hypothetical protein
MKNSLNVKNFAEWAGCLFGLLGAGILAMHAEYSGTGWIFFSLSNFFMIAYGFLSKARGLVVMQIGFTVTSSIGVLNWLIK